MYNTEDDECTVETSLCTDVPPPSGKIGRGDSRLPIFPEEGGRLYTGNVETCLVNERKLLCLCGYSRGGDEPYKPLYKPPGHPTHIVFFF